jgi:16S rRNA (cytosine967-C5)-methyltransferase
MPRDSTERLCVATGVPANLLARWTECYGELGARGMAAHSLVHAPTVVNVGRDANTDMIVGSFGGASLHEEPGFLVWNGTRADLSALLAAHPEAWVQDVASGRGIELARARTPALVLDLCAGQGGKTRQLLRTFPRSRIVASDADTARLVHLRELFRNSLNGSDRVEVRATHELDELRGRVELALLDVPCSNTGVLARRPEARYRFGRAQRRRLAEIQRSILERARELLAPGGAILYSTCSVEPEENERMVAWACERLGMRVERDALHLPRGLPGGPPERYTDASYAALMVTRRVDAPDPGAVWRDAPPAMG